MSLVIDPDFKAILGNPSADERNQLRANIERDGRVLDAVKVWCRPDGADVLLDGHTRVSICADLGIEYPIERIELADKEAALDWIANFQLGRRNLTDTARRYLLGREYRATKKTKGGSGANQYSKQHDQNDQVAQTTRNKIAAKHSVSSAQVQRAAAFSEAVDKAEAREPGTREKILREEKTVDKAGNVIDFRKRTARKNKDEKRMPTARRKAAVSPRKHDSAFRKRLEELRRRGWLDGRALSKAQWNEASAAVGDNIGLEVCRGKCSTAEWLRAAREIPYLLVVQTTGDSPAISIRLDDDLEQVCAEWGKLVHAKTGEVLPPLSALLSQVRDIADRLRAVFTHKELSFPQKNFDAHKLTNELLKLLAPYKLSVRESLGNIAGDAKRAC